MSKRKPKAKKETAAEKKAIVVRTVVRQAAEQKFEFFHDSSDTCFVTMPVDGHRETWRLRDQRLIIWVKRTLYLALGLSGKALLPLVLEEFEMKCLLGLRRDVFVRVAESNGTIYVDLGDDAWRVVEIRADGGWTILNDCPVVKFRRTTGMLPLPSPICGSTTLRDLQQFLNIGTQDDLILVLTWLCYSFRADLPYVILALSGPQGAGKSTIAKILRGLLDPSDAALCAPARNARDLAICAPQQHVVTLDNVSAIDANLSDALCRVATGGSHRERAYFTNDGTQAIHRFRNPVLLNGIGLDHLPLRADLLDRMIIVPCEKIDGTKMQSEGLLLAEFECKRPQFFAALLDAVSAGLRNVDSVELQDLPRMADFAFCGVAVEEALGFEPGSFIRAYRWKIEHASDVALDASPVAWLLHEFLKEHGTWEGTASALLKTLIEFGELCAHVALKNPQFPKAANQLSGELARIAPNLTRIGITVERGRSRLRRWIRLSLCEEDAEAKTVTVMPAKTA